MKTLLKTTFLMCCLVMLSGCSNGLQGTYVGNDNAFFDQLNFTSGNTVEIVFMGVTKEAEYTVDGKKVRITAAGETQVFTLTDKGCLDGGGMLGSYCKN
ncbi:MAG TPA: hypothetical protein PKL92_05640 [Aquaticitalea sp.]|nr:hypothetical protein [Aquaticitalea sp.]